MKSVYYPVLTLFLLSSCAPKLSTTWSSKEYQGKTYSKIAVVGISEDLGARNAFEKRSVELLKDNGINAVEGITVFPPNDSPKEGEDAKIIKILKDNKVDGVITMSLISTNESQSYEPGETYRVPMGWRRFGKYYYRTYDYISTAGYYKDEKSYLIEAVFYDVVGQLREGENRMVWTGQSSLVDPSSIEAASKSFTKRMVNQLLNDSIIIAK